MPAVTSVAGSGTLIVLGYRNWRMPYSSFDNGLRLPIGLPAAIPNPFDSMRMLTPAVPTPGSPLATVYRLSGERAGLAALTSEVQELVSVASAVALLAGL